MQLRSTKIINYIPQGRNIRKYTVSQNHITFLYYVLVLFITCLITIASLSLYITIIIFK
jgi:hypothetical protein